MENPGYQVYDERSAPPPYNPIMNPPVVNNVTVINSPIPPIGTVVSPIFAPAPIICRPPPSSFTIFDMMLFNCFHSCLWRKKYERLIDEESGKEIKKEIPMKNEDIKKGISLCLMLLIISFIILGIVTGIILGILAGVGFFNNNDDNLENTYDY